MKTLAASLAIGTASLLSLGAVVLPATAHAQPGVVVRIGPPPPPHEYVPPPRRGQVWAPGHYEWNGKRYVWNKGGYVRARPGYAYRAPHWDQRDGRWEYRAGGWDRDRDGVPNRYDRRPDNPYRS